MTTSLYLVVFAQAHHEFRIPEMTSVAELNNISLVFPSRTEDQDIQRPFMVIGLHHEDHARILAQRCILIKSIYEFYGQGPDYATLHQGNRESRAKWECYILNTSFRFIVTAYNHKIPQSRQHEIVESFSYMDFQGKIDMKTPEITLGCFEEYTDRSGTTRGRNEGDGEFRQVYFGRLIENGSARKLVGQFDVKKREYYGNTSMESEMSLLMANQAMASKGKLVYDPFIGTGSMAYPTAYFGALVFGSDIDGRQMRGKEKRPGIIRAATQYGVADRIVDLCTFDVTKNPWRCGGLFDAIVTDPPYGVRAGAKRLGRKHKSSLSIASNEPRTASRPDDQPYIPPTKPYELSDLARDLVLLARYLLKPGGRLVFFLPTVTDEYKDVDIHEMLCEDMEVIANSLQNFGSWGRRLVTIEKRSSRQYLPPNFDLEDADDNPINKDHIPAHKDFRDKYFKGFKKEGGE